MKRILLCLVYCISVLQSFAQQLSGTVTDGKGQALPYASVFVKGTSKGVVANSEGKYSIHLGTGNYTLVCQHVGYKTEEKAVKLAQESQVVDFRLAIQELSMKEVVIRRGEDPALEIIRQTIKKRDYYSKLVDSFSVEVYIKGLMRSRAIPQKVFGQKIDRNEMKKDGIDSTGKGILFLSESITKVSYKKPDKLKYEVVSSRESGGGFGLSFPFFIDFYTSNVSVFSGSLNPRGFISPIADNAFHYYKFHFEGSFFEGSRMIDRIKVTPRRKNEPLFEGYLQIVDGEWRIHGVDLLTTKDYQLDLIDTLRITQLHAPVTNDIWRTQNQMVYVAANMFGFDIAGNFLNVYSNYNMNPGFGKKFFDRIFMKYDSAFNRKDSSYWNTTRPVALEPDENRNFVFKDSVRQADQDSMFSRRHIDSLRRTQRKVKAKDFLWGGVRRYLNSTAAYATYRFEPLLKGVAFNSVEGLSLTAEQSLDIRPRKSNHVYTINSNTRYGFSNEHLNSFGTLTIKPRRQDYRNRYLEFSGGKRLSQFNQENPVDEMTNSIYTLFYRRNYLKVYENWFGRVVYNNKFESGLAWNIAAVYENRLPVTNTMEFSVFGKERVLLPNHPYELSNIPFKVHKALSAAVSLSYQPGQRYIQFPNRKVPIGSKYPTFELNYTKGIPGLLGSVSDFDKWKLSVHDDMNLKLLGTFRYRFSVGGFFNDSHVEIPDFQHFNGNQTFYNTQYLNSFQLAPYYQYSNTAHFYTLAHAEHHFNGLITNKIPLFNRLKWNLVAGTNTFYVNNSNYYVEAFAGLENIFKLFRLDFVTATQAQPGKSFGIRMGLGGILGGAVQVNRR